MPHLLLKEFEKGSKNSLIKKRIITHYIQNGCSTIRCLLFLSRKNHSSIFS